MNYVTVFVFAAAVSLASAAFRWSRWADFLQDVGLSQVAFRHAYLVLTFSIFQYVVLFAAHGYTAINWARYLSANEYFRVKLM